VSDDETKSTDPCASTPGTILRRCREFRGLSLQEAAGATKIAEHHLRALEDDCVAEFANPAYLKGFLRIYSDFLGLNPDDMIRLSERLQTPLDDAGSGQAERKRPAPRRRRSLPWKKLILPAVLLVMMIVTSVLLDHSPPPWQPSPSKSLPVAVPVAAVQPVRSSAVAAAPPGEADSEDEPDQSQGHEEAQSEKGPEAASESRGVVVHLRVVHNASLAVTMDGTTTQHYELTSGDTFEWKADRTIALELSDAASVAVELNGRALRALGSSGAPAFVVLDANGVRQQ
jgi:cytoskeletal protein RodZ